MSTFITLRLILQQPKPDIRKFLQQLSREELKKGDYDLLLRKAVESKVPEFKLFCDALVKKGANVNFFDSKDNISNLMLACEKGTIEMVSALLLYKDINILHSDKRQLNAGKGGIGEYLEVAVIARGFISTLKVIKVNREAANQTLLIAAIRKSKIELVKLLLEFKADPNWQVPDTGNTALHDAVKQLKSKVSQANREIIRLILWHGGDSMRKNKQQKTVYEYAEKALQELQNIQKKVKELREKQEIQLQILLQLNTQDDVSRLLSNADAIFDKYEEVSDKEEPMFLDEGQAYKGLNEQIYEIQKDCIEDHQQAYKEIQTWLIKLDKILNLQGLKAQIIGSFATGLWIKHSNIDLLLVKKDIYDVGFTSKEMLEQIYEQLKKSGICKACVFHNRNVRMPLIKAEVQSKGERNRVVHITMMDRSNNNSRAISHFILQQKERYPMLQPIFYVIKYLTYHYKLNQPKNGGLKTYALIIMLLSCIAKWNQNNPGKLLVDFLYYFGFYYDYQYEINQNANKMSLYQYQISSDHDSDQYLMALHILDPINPNNNVGKHVKALELQRMFKTAYITLHLSIPLGKRLATMFDSRKIILS